MAQLKVKMNVANMMAYLKNIETKFKADGMKTMAKISYPIEIRKDLIVTKVSHSDEKSFLKYVASNTIDIFSGATLADDQNIILFFHDLSKFNSFLSIFASYKVDTVNATLDYREVPDHGLMVSSVQLTDGIRSFKINAHETYNMAYVNDTAANRLFSTENSSVKFTFDQDFKKKLISVTGLDDDSKEKLMTVTVDAATKQMVFSSFTNKENWSILYDGNLEIMADMNLEFSIKPEFLKRFDYTLCDVYIAQVREKNYAVIFQKDKDNKFLNAVTIK